MYHVAANDNEMWAESALPCAPKVQVHHRLTSKNVCAPSPSNQKLRCPTHEIIFANAMIYGRNQLWKRWIPAVGCWCILGDLETRFFQVGDKCTWHVSCPLNYPSVVTKDALYIPLY